MRGLRKFAQAHIWENKEVHSQAFSIRRMGNLVSCEVATKPLPRAEVQFVGIDLGIESFAFLSDGNKIDNPRFFRSSEKKLAKAQRALSKEKKENVLGVRRYALRYRVKIAKSEKKLVPQKI